MLRCSDTVAGHYEKQLPRKHDCILKIIVGHKDTAKTDPLTLHLLGHSESYIIPRSLHLTVTWHK